MPTIRRIITDALSDAKQLAAGETATDTEASDGLRALVSMLAGFEADSIKLTTPPAAPGDERGAFDPATLTLNTEWPLELSHVEGVQALLAVRLIGEYGERAEPELRARARTGRRRLSTQFRIHTPLTTDPALLRTTGRGHYIT